MAFYGAHYNFYGKQGGLSFNLNCRSIKGLQDWLFSLTYATQARYAAAFLVRQLFLHPNLSKPLPYDNKVNCTNMNSIETSVLNGFTNPYCRYTVLLNLFNSKIHFFSLDMLVDRVSYRNVTPEIRVTIFFMEFWMRT